MSSKRALARRLGVVQGFTSPSPDLEQYRTPPEIAATLVHRADLEGDIVDHRVVDLGCGTGMLSLGAAMRNPLSVVGIERDAEPLVTARANERRVGSSSDVRWVRGDATRPPFAPVTLDSAPVTVLMNPPFGAQSGNEHADRAFLEATAEFADVSFSVHNSGSESFVESFAADSGGTVTHAFGAEFDLPRAFEFHGEAARTIDVEVFRIEWSAASD